MPVVQRSIRPVSLLIVERQVVASRHAHPEWGKQRPADELTKMNTWVPLVSPKTVKRILCGAGLWTEPLPP